jgi:hypothetical protein
VLWKKSGVMPVMENNIKKETRYLD